MGVALTQPFSVANNNSSQAIAQSTHERYRNIILKVVSVGIASFAFLTIQMGAPIAFAGTTAVFFCSTTFLSEWFIKDGTNTLSFSSKWFSTDRFNAKEIGLFILVALSANGVAGLIFTALGISNGQHVSQLLKTGNWHIIGIAVLVAPICEEILFRGFLKDRIQDVCYLTNRYIYRLSDDASDLFPIVGQAIIFGLGHMNSLQSTAANIFLFATTTGMGILQGIEQSLLTPIVRHMTINSAVTLRLLTFGR